MLVVYCLNCILWYGMVGQSKTWFSLVYDMVELAASRWFITKNGFPALDSNTRPWSPITPPGRPRDYRDTRRALLFIHVKRDICMKHLKI